VLQPTMDEIEAVGASGAMMTGVPTGFCDLDRLLNALHAGQLIIVAGRPWLGKIEIVMRLLGEGPGAAARAAIGPTV
jgi:replicative DNA helicase